MNSTVALIIWLLIGIALVSGAFISSGANEDHWIAFDRAGIAAGVYLVALLFLSIRQPLTSRTQLITWISTLVLGALIVLGWTGMDEQSHWQRAKLNEIHSTITRGILFTELHDPLAKTLGAYYDQKEKKREPIGDVFKKLHPNSSVGANIHQKFTEVDSLFVTVQSISETEVVLVGQDMYGKGRDPEFRNYNGRKGAPQSKAILESRGIRYESEN